MKIRKVMFFFILSISLSFSIASGAGDVAKGKAFFNDPSLGGATAGRSCDSCHPNGKGLEKAADRKDLREFVNSCIENALKGKTIDPKSEEMDNFVAYIQSLNK